jgi:hypothetical protein
VILPNQVIAIRSRPSASRILEELHERVHGEMLYAVKDLDGRLFAVLSPMPSTWTSQPGATVVNPVQQFAEKLRSALSLKGMGFSPYVKPRIIHPGVLVASSTFQQAAIG